MKLSKHEIITHTEKVSPKTVEIKAREEYKIYKDMCLGYISKVEKDYIDELEDMEINLLGDSKEKQAWIIAIIHNSQDNNYEKLDTINLSR